MADPRATFSFSGDPSGSLFEPPDYFSGQFNSYKADPRADGRYQRAAESGWADRQEDQRKTDNRLASRGNTPQAPSVASTFNPYVNEEYDSLFNPSKKKSGTEPQKSKYWELLQRLMAGDY